MLRTLRELRAIAKESSLPAFKGELRGKIEGILYVWSRVYVSIFDNIIPISFHSNEILHLKDDRKCKEKSAILKIARLFRKRSAYHRVT